MTCERSGIRRESSQPIAANANIQKEDPLL